MSDSPRKDDPKVKTSERPERLQPEKPPVEPPDDPPEAGQDGTTGSEGGGPRVGFGPSEENQGRRRR